MPRTVDDTVVSIEFDNKKFEKNAKQTMSTIDKLKAKLRFKKENRLSDNINREINNVDVSPMEAALHKFDLKCSAFEIARITGIQRIVNAAITAGANITRQLTTVPVSTGFAEYEEKMGSVQTIMAGTGESLENVKEALEKLNVYADKTIYSFKDMTSNIGKFTNAGVELNTAVDAIRGVSNVAALSGANAAEASRAMYNLAQALSAGYVKLIDWKSIENANMATMTFKESLLQTAAAYGKVKKNADGTYRTLKGTALTATRNFNETLQEQWLTTDVLIKTLRDYADETTEIGKKAYAAAQDVKTLSMLFDTLKEAVQSGWGTTWELIIGDFEEAKSFLTEIGETFSNFIGQMADARNYLLMGGLSKQANNWKKITNAISKTGITTDEFNNALIETGRLYVANLDDIVSSSGSFENSLRTGWLNSDIITETFKKFNDSLSNTTKVYTEEQKKLIQDLYKSASEQGGVVNNLIANMNNYAGSSGRENLLAGIVNIFSAVLKLAQAIGSGINSAFGKANSKNIYEFTERFQKFTKSLILNDEIFDKISRTVRGIASIFKFIGDIIKTTFTFGLKILGNLFGVVGNNLLDLTANFGDWITNTIKSIKNNEVLREGIIKLFVSIWNLTNKVRDFFKIVFNSKSIIDIFSKIINIFSNIIGILGIAISKIKEFFGAFKNIDVESMFKKIGNFFSWFYNDFIIGTLHLDEIFKKVFSFFVELIKKIFEYLKSSFPKVISFLGNVVKNIFSFLKEQLSKIDLKSILKNVFTKENIFYGALIAIGVKVLGKLKKGISSIFPEKSIKGIADSASSLFKNIALFVASLTLLTFIDFKSLKDVGDYLLSFLIRLTLIQKIFGKADFSDNIPYKLLLFVGGLLLIVYLISKTGSKAANGSVTVLLIIIGIISLLAVIVNAIKLLDNSRAMKTFGKFGSFVQQIGNSIQTVATGLRNSMEEISKAVKLSILSEVAKNFAIAVAILAAAVFALSTLPTKNVIVSAGIVVILMGALLLIVGVLSKINGDGVAKNAATFLILATSMILIASALSMIKDGDSAIKGAEGIATIILSLSIVIMLLNKFGNGITKTAPGFVILAAGIVIIAGALSILGSVAKPENMLAASLSLSILAVVLAIIMKLIAGVGGVTAIAGAAAFDVMAAGILIICIGLSQLANIDSNKLMTAAAAISIIAGVMTAIFAIIASIAATGVGALVLGAAVLVILGIASAVLMMASAVKVAAEGFQIFVNAVALLPSILDIFFNKLLDIITKSKDNAELAYEAGTSLLSNYIKGITDSISKKMPTMTKSLSALREAINLYLSSDTYYKKGIIAGQGLMQGFAFGIVNGIEGVNSAINSAFGIIDSNIGSQINTIAGNMASKQYKFQNSGVFLMQGLNNGLISPLSNIFNLMFGIGDGIIDSLNNALEIHSPSERTMATADYTADGFINQMGERSPDIVSSGEKFGNDFLTGTNNTLGNATLNDMIGGDSSSKSKSNSNSASTKSSNEHKLPIGADLRRFSEAELNEYGFTKKSGQIKQIEEKESESKTETKSEKKDIISSINDAISGVTSGITGSSSSKSKSLSEIYNENYKKLHEKDKEFMDKFGESLDEWFGYKANARIYRDYLKSYEKYFEYGNDAALYYNNYLALKNSGSDDFKRMKAYKANAEEYEEKRKEALANAAKLAHKSETELLKFWSLGGTAKAYAITADSGNSWLDANSILEKLIGKQKDWSGLFSDDDGTSKDTNKNVKHIMDSLNQTNEILGSGLASEKSYTFVQNNYSPKALSTVEIYRQTNNQLSRLGRKGW